MNIFKDKKFTLAFVMIVLSYLATFLVSFGLIRSVIYDNAVQMTTLVATRIHNRINDEMTMPINVGLTMAHDVYLIERLKKESQHTEQENIEDIGNYLNNLQKGLGYESVFLASEQSHIFYTGSGFFKHMDIDNDVHDFWYREFIKSGEPFVPNVDYNQEQCNSWAVFYNTRIEDKEGNLLGACGIGRSMNELKDMLAQFEKKYNVSVCLVNSEGVVQVDVDDVKIDKAVLSDAKLEIDNPDEYNIQSEEGGFSVTKYVASLSWFLVIRNNVDYRISAYSTLFFYFVILLVILLIILSIGVFIIIKRNNELHNTSFRDSLTGLINRNAYEVDIEELKHQPVKDISYITIDVNGLKKVNDGLGHQAGDILIRATAECITQYFSKLGKCYRIGGDEFAVIINRTNFDSQKICREFHELVDRWHSEGPVKRLSMSVGIAKSSDYESVEIEKLIEYADMAMYKEKEEYYKLLREQENAAKA